MLRAPELDAVLQVGSHKSGVKGQNHLPRPAGHTSVDAAQELMNTITALVFLVTLPSMKLHWTESGEGVKHISRMLYALFVAFNSVLVNPSFSC